MNLYEIAQNYRNLEDVIENAEDENLVEIVAESLSGLDETFENKVENIVKFTKNLRGQAEVIDNEVKRLQARKKSLDNKAEHLEKYLLDGMKFMERDKVQTGIFEVSIKKNPYSVNIYDDFAIEDKYLLKSEKITVDKKKIKEDIQNGIEVKGAKLERKLVLRVK